MVEAASVDDVRSMVTVLSSTAAPDGIPSQALLQVRNITSSTFVRKLFGKLAAVSADAATPKHAAINSSTSRMLQPGTAASDMNGCVVFFKWRAPVHV
jgi:hypothetical protein